MLRGWIRRAVTLTAETRGCGLQRGDRLLLSQYGHVRGIRVGRNRARRRGLEATGVLPLGIRHPDAEEEEEEQVVVHAPTKKPMVRPAVMREAQERPIVAIPPLIRARDLAKTLHQPWQKFLKQVAARRNRKFYMTLESGDAFEFANVKKIVVPFEEAQRLAEDVGVRVAYEDLEPSALQQLYGNGKEAEASHVAPRPPVIAVLGHVDHGKTTLLDALRGTSVAAREVHGITQHIHICETTLQSEYPVTFLDTPGHAAFFRMRSDATQVADLAVLVVAANEGCQRQTEEAIGALEDSKVPVIVCINKVDLVTMTSPKRIAELHDEIRSFAALQDCPILEISATNGTNLPVLVNTIVQTINTLSREHRLEATIGEGVLARGVVLEGVAKRGRGTVLRVLVQNGVLLPRQHFTAGGLHGIIRTIIQSESQVERGDAPPGMVVDLVYARQSEHVDVPLGIEFYALPQDEATRVVGQRKMAMDLDESRLDSKADDDAIEEADETLDDQDESIDGDFDGPTPQPIIIKADRAASLASLLDIVDNISNVQPILVGMGPITMHDLDTAGGADCPIFAFNVKMRQREAGVAAMRGIRVIHRTGLHHLLDDIEALSKSNEDLADAK